MTLKQTSRSACDTAHTHPSHTANVAPAQRHRTTFPEFSTPHNPY
jgi:hypothetical protein